MENVYLSFTLELAKGYKSDYQLTRGGGPGKEFAGEEESLRSNVLLPKIKAMIWEKLDN